MFLVVVLPEFEREPRPELPQLDLLGALDVVVVVPGGQECRFILQQRQG